MALSLNYYNVSLKVKFCTVIVNTCYVYNLAKDLKRGKIGCHIFLFFRDKCGYVIHSWPENVTE